MKDKYSLRSYARFMKRYKARFAITLVVFTISSGMLATIPIFIGRLVEAASAYPLVAGNVWTNVWILIGASTLHSITWQISEFVFLRQIIPLPYEYENGLFRAVINKPYPYFVGKFTGKVSSYIATLRREFDDLIDEIFFEYVRMVVVGVSTTSILFSVNVATGAVFVAGLILMVAIGRQTIKNNLKYEAVFTDKDSTKNGKVIDAVSNFANVKSFMKEGVEYRRLLREQSVVLSAKQESFRAGIVFWGSMALVVRNVIWPVAIIMNVRFFLIGAISVGELATFLSVILLFSSNIWEFIWHVSQFGLRISRIEEAHRYLFGDNVVDVADEPTKTTKHLEISVHKGFQIQGLSFAYPDQPDQTVLDGIDITIGKGEKIGVVGHSGSGKSTLVKLLLGYYPIESGKILVDGEIVSSDDLLSVISYVPQDTTLFNRTIASNIAYAVSRKVPLVEIKSVSKKALAHEFIETISDKYEAVVGERGVKLSVGQRQRLSIARAMLQDKPLLILDEATSALDSENEALVQKSLENLWQDRAVISIAHRLSTLRKMDRIIVMDKGRIVEDGSVKELLGIKGAFYDLWNHQVDGMIIE